MRILSGLCVFAASGVGLLIACGGDVTSPEQGTEGQRCFPNDTCNDGLTCLSHFCVVVAGGSDASLDAAADVATSDATIGDAPNDTTLGDAPNDTLLADAPNDTTLADAPSDGMPDAPRDASNADATTTPDAAPDSGTSLDAGCVVTPQKVGQYLSDPAPIQTATGNGYTLHKELVAYGNYGAQDGVCDILYDQGEVGVWTFAIPAGNIVSATVVLSMVIDDGATSDPPSAYSFRLWSGAACQVDSVGQLPHGMPFATRFTNWVELSYPATLVGGTTYTVTVLNTSMTGLAGWMAIDWVDVRIVTQ